MNTGSHFTHGGTPVSIWVEGKEWPHENVVMLKIHILLVLMVLTCVQRRRLWCRGASATGDDFVVEGRDHWLQEQIPGEAMILCWKPVSWRYRKAEINRDGLALEGGDGEIESKQVVE